MAKKILVVDTDGWTGCSECPAFNITGAGIRTCQASKNGYCESRRIYTKNKIPEWCPLKALPEKQGLNPDIHPCYEPFDAGYIEGWNDCVEAMGGEED